MIEAFEIGVSLALRDGVSEAVAQARRDVTALEHAVEGAGLSLGMLREAAAKAGAVPVADGARREAAKPALRTQNAAPSTAFDIAPRARNEVHAPAPQTSPPAAPVVAAVPQFVTKPPKAASAASQIPERPRNAPVRTAAGAPDQRPTNITIMPAIGSAAAMAPAPAPGDKPQPVPAPSKQTSAPQAPFASMHHVQPESRHGPNRIPAPSAVDETPTAPRAEANPPRVIVPGVARQPPAPAPAAPLPYAGAAGVAQGGEPRPGAVAAATPQAPGYARWSGSGVGDSEHQEPGNAPSRQDAPRQATIPRPPGQAGAPLWVAPRQDQATPPASDQRPQEGDVFLDGMLVGRWMSRFLSGQLERSSAGPTGFDPRRGRILPGVTVGT